MYSPSTMSINSSEVLQGQSGSLYMILTPFSGWQWVVTPALKRSMSNVSSSSNRSVPETPVKRKTPYIERKLKKRRLEETTTDLPEQLELFSTCSTVSTFLPFEDSESSRDSWPLKDELAWLQIEPLGEEIDFHCSEELPEKTKRCESPGLEGFVLE